MEGKRAERAGKIAYEQRRHFLFYKFREIPWSQKIFPDCQKLIFFFLGVKSHIVIASDYCKQNIFKYFVKNVMADPLMR